jgi:hypothetical protein
MSSDCGTRRRRGGLARRQRVRESDSDNTTGTQRGSQARMSVLAHADTQSQRRQEWWRERPVVRETDGTAGGYPGSSRHHSSPSPTATGGTRRRHRRFSAPAPTRGKWQRHGRLARGQPASGREGSRLRRPRSRRSRGGHVRARLVAPSVAPTPTGLRPCPTREARCRYRCARTCHSTCPEP